MDGDAYAALDWRGRLTIEIEGEGTVEGPFDLGGRQETFKETAEILFAHTGWRKAGRWTGRAGGREGRGVTTVSLERSPVVDLVGRSEIARRLGTTVGMVDSWRRRGVGFPEPHKTVDRTPFWLWPAVAAWAAESRPTGRRRKA